MAKWIECSVTLIALVGSAACGSDALVCGGRLGDEAPDTLEQHVAELGNAVRARVSGPEDAGGEIIVESCDKENPDCMDLKVVMKGGNPPYHFLWDDGTTGDKIHICLPDKSVFVNVMITDTAFTDQGYECPAATEYLGRQATLLTCPAR